MQIKVVLRADVLSAPYDKVAVISGTYFCYLNSLFPMLCLNYVFSENSMCVAV